MEVHMAILPGNSLISLDGLSSSFLQKETY